jgi:hypothetical protein
VTLQAGDPRSLLGGKPVTSVVVRELLTGRTATGYLTDEEYARAITETLPSRTAYADWAAGSRTPDERELAKLRYLLALERVERAVRVVTVGPIPGSAP